MGQETPALGAFGACVGVSVGVPTLSRRFLKHKEWVLMSDKVDVLEKLAPFCRKAGVMVTGREKLARMGGQLVFVMITSDLSNNSRREVLQRLPVPVVEYGTTEEIKRLFGLENAKIIGFKKNSLSTQILEALKPFLVVRPPPPGP
jgi:hypothetical protein